MDKLGFILYAILLVNCASDYEPTFTGKSIHHEWSGDKLRFNINGQRKEISLPTKNEIDFNNPIWQRGQDIILMQMTERLGECNNYSIVTFDMDGHVMDTIYQAEPCTYIEFMPSPNDKLLLIRTYKSDDRLTNSKERGIKYLVYNISKQAIQDSLTFDQTNLELDKFHESIWSPDSKNVLVFATGDNNEHLGFIYNFKDGKKSLDKGTNFIWSPTNNNLVSYLKDNKIIFKNLDSNEMTVFYQGHENKVINDFRWNPTGEYLVINFNGQFLNIDSKAAWRPTSILVSVQDKRESKVFERHNVYDSWK
jgi:hypothetical protein